MRWLLVVCSSTLLLVVFAQVPSLDEELGAELTTAATEPREVNQEDDITVNNEDNDNDNATNEENSGADSWENMGPENDTDEVVSEEGSSTTEDTNVSTVGNNTEISHEDQEEQESEENQSNQNDNTDENTSLPNSNENNEVSEERDSRETDVSRSLESTTNEVFDEPIETEGGLVQGDYLHGDSAIGIRSYYDIPYGSYSLFGVPQKHGGWDAIHHATEHSIQCPQLDETGESVVGENDCLTLSIFAPTDITNASVVFHIHDGDFKSGSGDPLIYGPEYLVPKGIILVLPNYRLGALGFLCLRNKIAPGNAALKDLTLALEWTKNNIAGFGGNSSKIIVSGTGSAAALAGYLALSPLSRDYVSGVIADSGPLLAHWALDRDPIATADALAESLREEIGEELDRELLIKAAKDIEFKPCIETGTDAFLDRSPWSLLHEGNINQTFMIGAANHAGLREAMRHTDESLAELNNNFQNFLPNDLKFDDSDKKQEIATSIKNQYFAGEELSILQLENISFCYTDAHYLGPSIRFARQLVAAGARVFFYEFSFVGELNRELQLLNTTVTGATRGDIEGYVFKQEGVEILPNTEEDALRETMSTLWVTFIQTGSPMGVEWYVFESVAESEEQWLSIGQEISQRTGLHLDRLSLWTHIYNEYYIERSHGTNFVANFSFVLVIKVILLFVIN